MEDAFIAKPLLTDELWSVIEPGLPRPRTYPKGGRPLVSNRATLTGILFVLKTGIPWEDLPREMGCGCGMTCWRRLRDWQKAGIWAGLHRVLLEMLQEANQIDWSRALIASASVRAVGGASKPAPTRRIDSSPAANTTSRQMPKGSRWPTHSPRPIARMASN